MSLKLELPYLHVRRDIKGTCQNFPSGSFLLSCVGIGPSLGKALSGMGSGDKSNGGQLLPPTLFVPFKQPPPKTP